MCHAYVVHHMSLSLTSHFICAAGKEEVELQLLLSYLPAQLSREELSSIVTASVAEAGAVSVKQMGQVMKIVTAKTAGRADGKMVSELVKAALTQK
jgi:uncharacterized protein YqeY